MVLLENTLAWSLLALVLVLALVVRMFISGTSAHARPIAVLAILAAALTVASLLVETPREHIAAICRDLARLVDDGDVNQIEGRLASDFEVSDMDREECMNRLSSALSRTRLDHVRIREIEIILEGDDRAVATFGANCNIRSVEGFSAALPSRWRLRFAKRGNQWLVQEAESIPIPPLNLRNPLSRH